MSQLNFRLHLLLLLLKANNKNPKTSLQQIGAKISTSITILFALERKLAESFDCNLLILNSLLQLSPQYIFPGKESHITKGSCQLVAW
ncbi:hypothetical protein FRX31_008280 [Thalictrum thalictroides]|uniref:Uncharacterized protein n=1 Tax=Thalictrum thalictroides TaxID=46969 RepID=A0A7J6X072_THATH|nr:hypothetical protein FRX31_008280 [Thalictrum thalictroides]